MKINNSSLFLLLLLLPACSLWQIKRQPDTTPVAPDHQPEIRIEFVTVTPVSTPSPPQLKTSPLPDLVVTFVNDPVPLSGTSETDCVDFSKGIHYGIKVGIKNVGQARAGPFKVTINGLSQMITAGLEAGQEISLIFPHGSKRVVVDQTSLVEENKEDNNEVTWLSNVTPSPPPTCTLMPSPTATATPSLDQRSVTYTPTPITTLTATPPP